MEKFLWRLLSWYRGKSLAGCAASLGSPHPQVKWEMRPLWIGCSFKVVTLQGAADKHWSQSAGLGTDAPRAHLPWMSPGTCSSPRVSLGSQGPHWDYLPGDLMGSEMQLFLLQVGEEAMAGSCEDRGGLFSLSGRWKREKEKAIRSLLQSSQYPRVPTASLYAFPLAKSYTSGSIPACILLLACFAPKVF